MNEPSDIVRYLENKVSKDLQLKHGYFAVKNRNSIEKKQIALRKVYKQKLITFLRTQFLLKTLLNIVLVYRV